jgi:hypothetical protein
MANLSNINNFFVVEQTTGYVGIGNTDPAFPLEVKSASAELALNATGGSIYRLKSDSTDYFRINKNGVGDRLVIAGGGDVGIGISAPTTKLHLGGTAPLDSIIRQDSTVSGTNWEIGERAAGKWQIWQDDGDTVVTTFMSTGNVGIGTESPTYKLDVVGNGRFSGFLEMVTGGAVYQGQKFYLDGGGDTFLESPSSNIMTFTTNAVEKMRIVSTGAVGIDNSSPDSFSGGGSTAASLVIGKGTSGVSPHITLWQGNSAQASLSFASANTGAGQYEGRIRYTRDTGVMDFRTNGIANVLVLNASGNVGIGTGSPNDILHVSDAGTATLVRIGNNGAYDAGVYFNTSTDWTIGTDTSNSNAFTIGNGSSVGASPKITITTGGNVGIGTTSPAHKLHVSGAAASGDYAALISNDSGGGRVLKLYNHDWDASDNLIYASNGGTASIGYEYILTGNAKIHLTSSDAYQEMAGGNGTPGTNSMLFGQNSTKVGYCWNRSTDATAHLLFGTSGTERMRIDAVGDISMTEGLAVQKQFTTGTNQSSGQTYITIRNYDAALVDAGDIQSVLRMTGRYWSGSTSQLVESQVYSGHEIGNGNGGSFLGFATQSGGSAVVEAMRIGRGGKLHYNCTDDATSSSAGLVFYPSGDNSYIINAVDLTSSWNHLTFINTNGTVGSISTSGSATAFNTSSDYRLKEDLKEFNGLDIVSQIKTYDFKWKDNDNYEDCDKRGYGVIAHEVEIILPQIVKGEKDAVNKDGSINPQGVDYAKIVPLLVKSIQELKAEIETLKNK